MLKHFICGSDIGGVYLILCLGEYGELFIGFNFGVEELQTYKFDTGRDLLLRGLGSRRRSISQS